MDSPFYCLVLPEELHAHKDRVREVLDLCARLHEGAKSASEQVVVLEAARLALINYGIELQPYSLNHKDGSFSSFNIDGFFTNLDELSMYPEKAAKPTHGPPRAALIGVKYAMTLDDEGGLHGSYVSGSFFGYMTALSGVNNKAKKSQKDPVKDLVARVQSELQAQALDRSVVEVEMTVKRRTL